MTTFVQVSPHVPESNVYFVEHLASAGVTVLGIGDVWDGQLSGRLRGAMADYYRVESLDDFEQVAGAMQWMIDRHGPIDWVESNSEYWLGLDAGLRTRFGITTGHTSEVIPTIRSKAGMKPVYQGAGIPTARQAPVTDLEAARAFAVEVGYPLFFKPEYGIGATDTFTARTDDDLAHVMFRIPPQPYVMEEYVTGSIVSYDAILDADGEPVFEAATQWPPSIAAIVEQDLDLTYRVLAEVPEQLRERGRATSHAFGMFNRFVHLEFFRLIDAKPGLGEAGDFIALEANMRAAGGATLDMYNFARNADVYQIYADLVSGHDTGAAEKARRDRQFCVYAGRRDHHGYALSSEEIWWRYGSDIVRAGRNDPMYWPQMGQDFFMLRTPDKERADAFARDVLHR